MKGNWIREINQFAIFFLVFSSLGILANDQSNLGFCNRMKYF